MKLNNCEVFPEGAGQVADLIRAHDWSASSLGHPGAWPPALRTVVSLMLSSRFPMFVAWGPALSLVYNDEYAKILEHKHPKALGNRFDQVWSDIWADIEPIAQRALEGHSEYFEDLPLTMNRKGFAEETWFTFSYSPARDDEGKIAGVFCTCTETTGEVLAQRQREAEYLRFRELFQNARGLVAIVREPNHRFEFANDAYMQLVGQRQLIGRPLHEALPEVAAQGFVEILDGVFKSGEPYIGSEASVHLNRGGALLEERFVDFILQPIRDADGQVTGVFIEGRDVTERVLAGQALQQTEKRKDEFLAMLAHELRNPLAPVSTAAQILKRPNLSEQTVQRTGAVIARQVAHMTRLVDDLLDVSRVTRGLVKIKQDIVNLVAVVEEAVEQTQPAIQEKGLNLFPSLPTGPMFVRGDRTRLVQVVSNLLQNAAKFTPAQGHIWLRLAPNGGNLELQVTDDGVGMSQQLLPHVFELFTQGERASDRSQGGLGLGLPLVKSLVVLHGGSVSAHSAGLGKGSAFVLLLPHLEAAVAERQADGPAEQPVAHDRRLKVMVVDDNEDAASTLCTLLEAMGHQTFAAFSATAALSSALDVAPELLFLDIGMPNVDGYELARRMRQLPQTAHSTLVALTGYAQPDDKAKALQAGFDRHFAKPISLEELQKMIGEHPVRTQTSGSAS